MPMFLYIIFYLIFSVSGLLLMKTGSGDTSIALLNDKLIFNIKLQLLLGGLFYIISFILWVFILKISNLNYIFPIVTGLGYFFIMISSFFILKEPITLMQLIGSIVIFLGIILINVK